MILVLALATVALATAAEFRVPLASANTTVVIEHPDREPTITTKASASVEGVVIRINEAEDPGEASLRSVGSLHKLTFNCPDGIDNKGQINAAHASSVTAASSACMLGLSMAASTSHDPARAASLLLCLLAKVSSAKQTVHCSSEFSLTIVHGPSVCMLTRADEQTRKTTLVFEACGLLCSCLFVCACCVGA